MSAGFLGVPGVEPWLFIGLTFASFATNWMGLVFGTAGGLLLLVIMASFASIFPPAVLVPMHTIVQLCSGGSRVFMMWDWVLKDTLVPFIAGAVIGATLGASIFVSLPAGILMGMLAVFVIIVTWMPSFGQVGSIGKRFAIIGFVSTFLGVFVSATGTLVSPFVAAASPDRRNHAATLAALMSISHATKMVAFVSIGFALGAYVPLIAAMIAGGIAGNWAGERTLHRVKEEWFRIVFKIGMTLMASRLLWIAAKDMGWV